MSTVSVHNLLFIHNIYFFALALGLDVGLKSISLYNCSCSFSARIIRFKKISFDYFNSSSSSSSSACFCLKKQKSKRTSGTRNKLA